MVGVDVGGTFTDIVLIDDSGLRGWKVPTSTDQSEAVSSAVSNLDVETFLHGTTAGTNTLLEGRGAQVSLVTTPGFEDLIEIGRQDRPALYDSFADRPEPLVPRDRRHSDPGEVGSAEIVAVALLDSYSDGTAEIEAAGSLQAPTVLSSQVSPEFREYERVATTVLSAYLTPSIASYLGRLDERLAGTRLVMTSAGGLIPFSEAAHVAGRLVLSGPAGGAVAAAALGRHHGYENVISFDMGGTSTDVSRITGGTPKAARGYSVAGRVNRVPSIPIRTIGAGGGSVAWVDSGGALRVGPRSSGAKPGPAVYGLGGTEMTVTDANVLIGNLPRDLALGGSVRLDFQAGLSAATRLAGVAGMSVESVTAGVIEVVDAHMERALRSVSVEEGADPRDSVLVAFGGAGGLHAARLGKRLGVQKVLIPPHSGVFSALGLLLATPRADAVRTVLLDENANELGGLMVQITDEASSRFDDMFGTGSARSLGATVDVRYRGQSHELEVGAAADWELVRQRFASAHAERFGFARDEAIEVVNVRATATGKAPLSWKDLSGPGVARSDLSGAFVSRAELGAGSVVSGHAVVVETDSATLVEEGDLMTVLEDGTLEITW